MASQEQSSDSPHAFLTVTVDGVQLDIKAASEKQPENIQAELIRALRFVKLSPSDLALIQLQETFRVSLGRPRSIRADKALRRARLGRPTSGIKAVLDL